MINKEFTVRDTKKILQAAYWLGYMKSSLDNEDIDHFLFGKGMFTNYYKVVRDFPNDIFKEYTELVNEFEALREGV